MRVRRTCLMGIVAIMWGGWMGSSRAQDASTYTKPAVEGPISALSSGSDFYVGGKHITANSSTMFMRHVMHDGRDETISDAGISKTLVVGDAIQVFGDNDRHSHTLVASKVILEPQKDDRVAGYAVIQRVVATSPQLVLEADGYRIAITPKTVMKNKAPLNDKSAPVENMWISYSGRWNKDGLVVADRASYTEFAFGAKFKKGLEKSEGKLVEPVYGDGGGAGKKDGEIVAPYLYGSKHTASIPADRAVQERVQRIGERLIPASQKMLAKDDPQKIDFRFYAVDEVVPQAVGSPDGVVILPTKVLQQLQGDDQVAAVLSEAVAEAVEWQVPPVAKGNSGAAMAILGGMPFVGPVAGIALESGALYQMEHGNYATRFDPLQSERVGLALMHDAGYDVRLAPVAWQTLRYGNAKQANKPLTEQSAYLLGVIGQEYAHDGAVTSAGEQAGSK